MKNLVILLTLLVLSLPVSAKSMRATIYDDGQACPNQCDAHVVLNKADNGTAYAHSPDSSRNSPRRCKINTSCTICFSDKENSCMIVMYRGRGPGAGRFDFTPAFYRENCGKSGVPAALKAECDALDADVKALGYDKAINCFESPNDKACVSALAKAKIERDADLPKRIRCIAVGAKKFNKEQKNAAERRSKSCNYSQASLGGSGTKKWRLLKPAACRAGTYVDRYGLDCCSADVRFAAHNHPECRDFFPAKTSE